MKYCCKNTKQLLLALPVCLFCLIFTLAEAVNAQFYLAPAVADVQLNYNQSCPWQTLNTNGMNYLTVQEWTWSADGCSQGSVRGLYRFDLNVPSAQNELYDNRADLLLFFPDGNSETHQYYTDSGANEFLVRRVVQDWDESIVTWETQPLVSPDDSIEVGPSSTMPSTEDYVVDISTMVSGWLCGGLEHYGVSLRQSNEGVVYRRVTFTTREWAVESERPSIRLQYARIDAVGPSNVCPGTSVDISAQLTNAAIPAEYNFSWVYQNTGQGLPGASHTMLLQQPGEHVFILTATNSTCQTATDTLVITVSAPVSIDAGDDVLSGCASDISIDPVVSGGNGVISYQWIVDNATISQSEVLQTLFDATAIVSVTATDECGTTAQDQVMVTIQPSALVVEAGADQSGSCLDVFELEATAAGASGQVVYTWFENNIEVFEGPVMPIQVGQSTNYVVTALDECGASDSDNVTIEILPSALNLVVPLEVSASCVEEVVMIASLSGNQGTPTYSWNNELGELSNTDELQEVFYQNTVVQLTVVDECGNNASASISIEIPPSQINIDLPEDTVVCSGDFLQLNALVNGGSGMVSGYWSGLEDQGLSPVVSPLGPHASYTFYATDQCGNTASASMSVIVSTVQAAFEAESDDNIDYAFVNASQGADSLIWYFPDGTVLNEQTISYQNNSLNSWVLQLEAIGEGGCRSIVEQQFAPHTVLYVPNAFTPNGDGLNDVLNVLGADIVKFRMHIYNRWGEEVFFSDALEKVWTGGKDDGSYFVPDGVYYYHIVAQDSKKNVFEVEGQLTIVR